MVQLLRGARAGRPALRQERVPTTSSHLNAPPWARRKCACCATPKPRPATLASSAPPAPPPPPAAAPTCTYARRRSPSRRAVCSAASRSPSPTPTTPSAAIAYLYDGQCPLRKPEVDALRRLDNGRGRIEFVDISTDLYDPAQYGDISYEEAMGPPAAILNDGTVVRNVEVYRKLYEAVGLGFVWSATKLPLVRPVVDWVFHIWAENRLRLTNRPPLATLVRERELRRKGLDSSDQ